MKTALVVLSFFLCLPVMAGKEPKVYDHVGVMGAGVVHPDYQFSSGEHTVNCYDHTSLTDCSSSGNRAFFEMTFDDGKTHMLEMTLTGKTVLQDIQLSKNPDKHFRYRLAPDREFGRHTGIMEHVVCTPNRDKQGHETKGESCFGYTL